MADPRGLTLPELEHRAAALWTTVPPGGVLWLSGELGTGKTAFVQALARAAGAAPALSPTYALVHEYRAPEGILIHVDCYRLRAPDEARDLDFPDLQRRARLLVVEWPERAGAWAPPADAHLVFGHAAAPDRRTLERVR